MALAQAKVSIVGTRPILWHKFGPEAIPLERQERTGVAGNDPEEWKRTYLATSEGQLYVEPSYIYGCLRDAARYTKKGISSIQSKVAATLQVMDDKVLLDRYVPENVTQDSSQLVYLHVAGVRNPGTKSSRNVRYRLASSLGWKTTFTIVWDRAIVSLGEMEKVIEDAGMLVGLADGRSIGFGRFEVESIEVTDYAKEKTA